MYEEEEEEGRNIDKCMKKELGRGRGGGEREN